MENVAGVRIFFLAAILWLCLNFYFMPDNCLSRYENPYAAKESIISFSESKK